MNLSPLWTDFLMMNGIEAAHWSFIGPPDAPDTEIFFYAKIHNFTVLTNDLDCRRRGTYPALQGA
jgi:predicted nuclease of predicted toxin-antitoxin system